MGRSAMTFMPPKQRRSQGSLERNLYTGGSPLPLHGHFAGTFEPDRLFPLRESGGEQLG